MRDQQIVKVREVGQPIHAMEKSFEEAHSQGRRAEQLVAHTEEHTVTMAQTV